MTLTVAFDGHRDDRGAAFADAGAGVAFTNGTGLVVSEAGGTDTFQVALQTAPERDVLVSLQTSDAGEGMFLVGQDAVTVVTLVFTARNWNTPQSVTVVGMDDNVYDGDRSFDVVASVLSNDPRYDLLPISSVSAINVDDDQPDEWVGDNGDDLHMGGHGASDLYGQNGRDELYGGNGDDRLYGGYGDDVLYGEADNDQLYGELGIDQLCGDNGDDRLYGGYGDDVLCGEADNDQLYGELGIDRLNGGEGDDLLNGGDEDDWLDGGEGDDLLNGGDEDDWLYGREGDDLLNGGDGDDVLYGHVGNDFLDGGAGSDTLLDGDGNDTVQGGAGNDQFIADAGGGNDRFAGGGGKDTISYVNESAGLVINLASGEVTDAAGGKDTVKQIENAIGGRGDDTLKGNGGDNKLDGAAGNDVLRGGSGRDTLVGGSGNDVFDFDEVREISANESRWDVITDFVRGMDRIDLSSIDADVGSAADDAFSGFIAADAGFSTAGQLQLRNSVLYGNTDADATAEFALQLTGVTGLGLGDIVL